MPVLVLMLALALIVQLHSSNAMHAFNDFNRTRSTTEQSDKKLCDGIRFRFYMKKNRERDGNKTRKSRESCCKLLCCLVNRKKKGMRNCRVQHFSKCIYFRRLKCTFYHAFANALTILVQLVNIDK